MIFINSFCITLFGYNNNLLNLIKTLEAQRIDILKHGNFNKMLQLSTYSTISLETDLEKIFEIT